MADKPKNPRKARKAAKSANASKLAEALNFVQFASASDPAFAEHARIAGHWIVATNGYIAAGHKVEEDFAICPHIGRMIDGLNKAGSTLALTVRDNGTILVSGDKLRAVVPCIPGDDMPSVEPDPNCAVIDDRIKEGFAKLLPLLKLEAERTLEITILLRNNSMFACNGSVIFEYWHGIDLPPWGMAIPKHFVDAIARQSKKLTGFGFSDKSVTLYFEDGAWLKTQLYRNDWPNVDDLFNVQAFPAPVPEGLFEGVRAIESFSEDGGIHFHDDKLKSTYDNLRGDSDGPVYGATYDVPGLQGGHSFTGKLLRLIEPVCDVIDYTTSDDRAMFGGEMLRGVIMKRSRPAPPPPPVQWTPAPASDSWGAAMPDEVYGDAATDPNASAWGAASTQWGNGNPFMPDEDDVPF